MPLVTLVRDGMDWKSVDHSLRGDIQMTPQVGGHPDEPPRKWKLGKTVKEAIVLKTAKNG